MKAAGKRSAMLAVWRTRAQSGCCGRPGAGFSLIELVMVVAILATVASLVMITTAGVQEKAESTTAFATLHALRDAICGTPDATGYLSDMKYVPGFHNVNLRVHDLLSPSSCPAFAAYDPQSARGWRGPYMRNVQPVRNINAARNGLFPAATERRWSADETFQERSFYGSGTNSCYGMAGDQAVADPWGNPVVLQVPPAEVFALSSGDAKRFRYARLVCAGTDGRLQTPVDRTAGMQADGTCPDRGDDLVLFLNRPDVYEPEEP
jgi:prepilin-type N-terminal cleavage/methylation domain-containing protein